MIVDFGSSTPLSADEPLERRVGRGYLRPSSSTTRSSRTAPVPLSSTYFQVGIGTISASNLPAACAAAVRCWLCSAVLVLRLARDLIVFGDVVGGLQHRHEHVGSWRSSHSSVNPLRCDDVLHHPDRLAAAGDDDVRTVGDDALAAVPIACKPDAQ